MFTFIKIIIVVVLLLLLSLYIAKAVMHFKALKQNTKDIVETFKKKKDEQ